MPSFFSRAIWFKCAYLVSKEVAFLSGVKPYVIPFRFKPVNLFGLHEKYMPVHLDYQTLEMNWFGLYVFDRSEDSFAHRIALFACKLILHPFERLVETFLIERLQKVVECIDLKSAHGVLIVRGYEYDCWRLFRRESFENTEAIDAGHLYVQENKIG